MWTVQFWKQAGERAFKTFAQGVLVSVTADGLGVFDVNWGDAFSVAGLLTIASLLTSIVTSGVGEPNDPSMVKKTAA